MVVWSRLTASISKVTRTIGNSPSIGRINRSYELFRRRESLGIFVRKPTVFTFGSFTSAFLVTKKMDAQDCSKVAITEADKFFDEGKFTEALELLEKQGGWESNAQILWRVARCKFQLSKAVKDDKEKTELINNAYELVKKSLELDEKNGLAHKWAAILLDAVSTLKGTKERVLQVLNVREHMEKAVELAPYDATSYYLLGEWHFSCYQVSWWERKIASLAFGKLPDADMEVALKMFEKAEEVEKDFYSKNKLMLAKTLMELKRDLPRAKELLEEVITKYSSSEKWDDKEACEEANKLIKNLK